jgi:3-oxoadipate enol-lactonase
MMSDMVGKTTKSRDGLDLYYETRGMEGSPRGARPVVFFLHGIGGDVDAWRPVNEGVMKEGYATIAMDLRGHGYSGHPRTPSSHRIINLVDDMAVILEQEGIDTVFVVGHCYGAVVGLHFALRYPERTRAVAVLSGTYRSPEYLGSAWLRSLSGNMIDVLSWLSPPPIHPGHSYYPPGKIHKDYEMFGLARTIARNSLRSYLLTSKEIVTLDLLPRLPSISALALIVVGEEDSIFPVPISRAMHRSMNHSSFAVIPGGNHCIILNNAEEVIELLCSFLGQQS